MRVHVTCKKTKKKFKDIQLCFKSSMFAYLLSSSLMNYLFKKSWSGLSIVPVYIQYSFEWTQLRVYFYLHVFFLTNVTSSLQGFSFVSLLHAVWTVLSHLQVAVLYRPCFSSRSKDTSVGVKNRTKQMGRYIILNSKL